MAMQDMGARQAYMNYVIEAQSMGETPLPYDQWIMQQQQQQQQQAQPPVDKAMLVNMLRGGG